MFEKLPKIKSKIIFTHVIDWNHKVNVKQMPVASRSSKKSFNQSHFIKAADLWILWGIGCSVSHMKYIFFYGLPRAYAISTNVQHVTSDSSFFKFMHK